MFNILTILGIICAAVGVTMIYFLLRKSKK
jgi:hypothetical protein